MSDDRPATYRYQQTFLEGHDPDERIHLGVTLEDNESNDTVSVSFVVDIRKEKDSGLWSTVDDTGFLMSIRQASDLRDFLDFVVSRAAR